MILEGQTEQQELPLGEPFWLTKMEPNGHYGAPVTAKSSTGLGLRDFAVIAAEIFERIGPPSSWPAPTIGDTDLPDREPPCSAAAMHGVDLHGELQQVAA